MRRYEVAVILLLAIGMITTGVVWLVGPWGLIAVGAVLLISAFIVNIKEG